MVGHKLQMFDVQQCTYVSCEGKGSQKGGGGGIGGSGGLIECKSVVLSYILISSMYGVVETIKASDLYTKQG